jgi:L-aspartate oxidase
MTDIDTDVLIVGAGAAGLVTALSVSGRQVTIATPDDERCAHAASDLAQGGVAAALGPDDTPALHVQDTLLAGLHQNFQPVVRFACREAPAAVTYLAALGVGFTRTADRWSLHREAAHCRARVAHAGGDATGAAIMDVLRRRIADTPNVEVLSRTRVINLLQSRAGVCGVTATDATGRTFNIRAHDIVIATGGVGGLYKYTTNPRGACGDGVAMALAAGARCAALEFVQFHPTALDVDARPLPLLTEALRGAGAVLIDEAGKRIMPGVHPLAELAPRDVVARAIYAVQRNGGRIRLDATRLAGADLPRAFPSAYRACQAYGIDAAREPIPVTPAAHYHMGGIEVDLDGRTSLPGLWAVGEAACTGLHGANRLASNSLLEAVVFGRRLGQVLAGTSRRRHTPAAFEYVDDPGDRVDESSMREIRELMWRCMGVERDAVQLAAGLTHVWRLRQASCSRGTLWQNRLLLIEHMLRAAADRRTSCGAHFRSDADTFDPVLESNPPSLKTALTT